MRHVPIDLPDDPKLTENITHFARALRKAGLNIGSGRIADAIKAVTFAGFTNKADFFWTLHACFVSRPEDRAVFAQIFRLYWRDPQFLEHMMTFLTPAVRGVQEDRRAQAAERRAAQALLPDEGPETTAAQPKEDDGTEIDIDARQTTSAEERLKTLDFEQMTTAEMAQAKRLLARIQLPVPPMPSRRLQALPGTRADWRGTMRQAMRQGGEVAELKTRRLTKKPPGLVVLCDISGSMADYSRAVLHFVHAVANRPGQGWGAVHAFTFGTRLTNITQHMRTRDVDAALAMAGAEAQDWEGGTRIASCLTTFNRDWSRRVLGQGAVVLLITDGLDRDPEGDLAKQMERLSLTARQVIWLNPLLRFDSFAPKAQGVRAMLPFVDVFRAGHNIAAFEGLAAALAARDSGDKSRVMGMMDADNAQETDRLGWSLQHRLASLHRRTP